MIAYEDDGFSQSFSGEFDLKKNLYIYSEVQYLEYSMLKKWIQFIVTISVSAKK